MLVILSGIVMSVSFSQPLNAHPSIFVIPLPNETLINPEHPFIALQSMLVTLSGIVKLVSPLQS